MLGGHRPLGRPQAQCGPPVAAAASAARLPDFCPLRPPPAMCAPWQDFTQEVYGVGHRVVHGREISEPVLIT